jgi:tetratricopeptide (TPR) repeat protein
MKQEISFLCERMSQGRDNLLYLYSQGIIKRGNDIGNNAFELELSEPSSEKSFSAGSAVTVDSFPCQLGDGEGDNEEFFDPYLLHNRRIYRQLRILSDDFNFSKSIYVANAFFDGNKKKSFNSPGHVNRVSTSAETAPLALQGSDDLELGKDRVSRKLSQFLEELNFWKTAVADSLKYHGTHIHLNVGEGMIMLGNAHFNCSEFTEAFKVYCSALRIFKRIYGMSHLTVAKSLDKIGLVCNRIYDQDYWDLAKASLEKSYSIRYACLGTMHVDTVDTLNNLACTYLNLREYTLALKAYQEVFIVRQIIFGAHHASVGITAHALGSVYLNLARIKEAYKLYHHAMIIFKTLDLHIENPVMRRLVMDIKALDRVKSFTELVSA